MNNQTELVSVGGRVNATVRKALERQAKEAGLSLSSYIAYVLTGVSLKDCPKRVLSNCRAVNDRGSFRITIPPRIAAAIGLTDTCPMVATEANGALLAKPAAFS